MNFVSIAFFVFLPIVFILYWIIGTERRKTQNLFLLVASFIFYGYLDYRFCFLLAASILLCYWGGLKLSNPGTKNKKKWLIALVSLNLSSLIYFKYFNFFIESFASFLSVCGLQANVTTLSILLPLGISFYTFHGLSYLFDVYNGKTKVTKSLIDYALFVSFFPLLVAGPIERATHLLPQLEKKRKFNYSMSVDGCRQILWGFFKKLVIADNCAGYTDYIFSNYEIKQGSTLVLGAVLFAIQIYADFSGYSDIAIGVAKLFGIKLLRNFALPYFSRDIAEFWRRWHISLTTWFRDYLYIPLGGSRGGKWQTIRNTFVIFLVSGFWHGANWTFISWGFIHVLFFIPLLLVKKNRHHLDIVAEGRIFPNIKELFQMILTFSLVCFAWIFFRAENITIAFDYIKRIFSFPFFSAPLSYELKKATILSIIVMFVAEWLQRDKQHALQLDNVAYRWLRWGIYLLILYAVLWLSGEEQTFIYFQF
ncbi:MBOAT family O-acyltransferase [Viscerimonas tarda]